MAFEKKATRYYKGKWFNREGTQVYPGLKGDRVLARNVEEARDQLLSLFFTYRHTVNMGKVRPLTDGGASTAVKLTVSRTYEETEYYNRVTERDSHEFEFSIPDIHAETFDPR